MKILGLIKKWGILFENKKDKIPNFTQIYKNLNQNGIVFPENYISSYNKYLSNTPLYSNDNNNSNINNNNSNINNNNSNINNNNNNINNNNSKINNNNSNINTSTINNNNSNINTSTINNNKEDVFDYFENIKEIINPSKFDKKYVNLLEHLRLMIENISYGNELIDNKNKEDLNEVMNNLKKGNNSLMKLIEKGKVKNEYLMEICLGIIDDTNRTLNRIDNFNMGKKIGKFISYFIENEKFFNNDNKKKMKSKFNNIF